MANDYHLTFEVTKPEISWFRTLLTGFLSAGRSTMSVSAKRQWITAVNMQGENHRVEKLESGASDEVAQIRIEQIERDLNTLPLPAWCAKYRVPESFVEAGEATTLR